MFDNFTNISQYNYEVNLETIVKAVCEISLDIGKQLEDIITLRDDKKGFTILDLFSDNTLIEMSIRPEEVLDRISENGEEVIGMGKEGFISKISSYFNENITQIEEFEKFLLSYSEVVVINRKTTRFMTYGEKGIDKLLTAIKKTKVIKILVSKLNNERIKKSLEKLEIFENDIFYKNVVECSKLVGKPDAILIKYKFFNEKLLSQIPVDENDIWINTTFYKKRDEEFSVDGKVSLLTDRENNEIGVLVGDHIIPYPGVNLSEFVKQEQLFLYYFSIIKESFTKKKRDNTDRNNIFVKNFISASKNPKLNQLLSHLKNNFYIDGSIIIDDEFKEFFNSVVSFEQLLHLEEYHFLLSPSIQEETMLGIYSRIKKEKDYNLIHWLNHDGDESLDHYRNVSPTKRKKKIISTLKPAICYYFLSKYYEDFVESILKNNDYNFISNHQIFIDNNEFTEIDFLVQTANKIVYIEAKTKLTKNYIEAYLKTCSKLLDRFKPLLKHGVKIEFLLLGCFSDESVADYQFFINEGSENTKGYNVPREGLNCIPFNFSIPIPDKPSQLITCIAEPEFEKLQNLLLKICPK